MVLKNVFWEGRRNGRQRKLFTVRSMGAGRGYGILETYHNIFVLFSDGISREAAKQLLETRTMDDYNRWIHSQKKTLSSDAWWRLLLLP
jgi:hypothetical protein